MIIGLTGSFSSGKTTAAKIFKTKKVLVIDADKIAHQVIYPKTSVWKKIAVHFGPAILKSNGYIDRNKLGSLVFENNQELKWLSAVVHPAVISKIKVLIKKYKRLYPKKIIVVDVPLLFEAGLNYLSDKLIVVKCRPAVQIARAKLKTGLSRREIVKRINLQLPISAKIPLADFVIDNSGSLMKTKKQVLEIYQELLREAR